jgi:ABC-type Fe3+ transport system substrate-binding protein
MNRQVATLFSALTFCGFFAVHPFPAPGAPLDPYIEGAKKEGTVTLGITLREKSHGKPAGELYLAAFQKRYPFLKVNFKRVGGARERERVLTEMASGISEYDVSAVSETMIPTIVDAKLVRIVEWEKLGVPKYFIHPKNYGLGTRTSVYGIAYNRTIIPDDVAKTFTWESCTDPKWKGRTAMNDRPRHLNRLYLDDQWGRAKTLDYAKRWAANKPVLEASQSTATEKLTVGSYAMICGLARRQVEDIVVNTGSKAIGIVFPEPVPVGSGEFQFVPVSAKHPHAAILFMVWTSTKEAQNILDDTDFSGDPRVDGSNIKDVLKGKKVAYPTWEDVGSSDDHLAEIFQAMGLPVVR